MKKVALILLVLILSVSLSGCSAIIAGFIEGLTGCSHEYQIVKEVPATCTDKGEIHKYCTLCEETEVEYVEALGHDMQETSRTEPVVGKEGIIYYQCSRCETTSTETIPPLQETWRDKLPESLVREIENAVAVIDENEWGVFTVSSVDLVEENDGYICTFRYYKLTIHWTFEPTERDREYVIRTREWHDGEPEKEVYPNEYLECINSWISEDNLTGGALIWSLSDGYIE